MIRLRASRTDDVAALTDIWRRAVRATHDFLSPNHFDEIETLVATRYLPQATLSVAVDAGDRPLGFMGMSDAHIDSLFICPAEHGKGIGRMLVRHAQRSADAVTVDVNEQNGQAVAFYRRLGFVQIGRSDTDGDGRPYPVLHLQLATAVA